MHLEIYTFTLYWWPVLYSLIILALADNTQINEAVIEWYDKCDASTGVRWVDIDSNSMVSRVDNGLAERPSLDVPIWKKHPVKRLMKLVVALDIRQEVWGFVQEYPPSLSESQIACSGTANSDSSVLNQDHSVLHNNGSPLCDTAENLSTHQDNLNICDNSSPCCSAESLVSNQENSVSFDNTPSTYCIEVNKPILCQNHFVTNNSYPTSFNSTATLIADHDHSVSSDSSSTCRCNIPELILPSRKRSDSTDSSSTCCCSTPEHLAPNKNHSVTHDSLQSLQSSVPTLEKISSTTPRFRKTRNRSDRVSAKPVLVLERDTRAFRVHRSVSTMKDHGFLSTNWFVSKLVDKFKFNRVEKLDKESRERYGKTSDRSSRTRIVSKEDRGCSKGDRKKEKYGRNTEERHQHSKARSKHIDFKDYDFTNDEDTNCDDAISSDFSSWSRSGSPLNFGSVLNMEKDPPMPKASHGHIRSIKSEAAFKVTAPEPLPNPRDYNKRSSRVTALSAEDPGLPVGEIRIQILTPEEGRHRAEEYADAQTQNRNTHKTSYPADSQHEHQDRRPRSGLYTWTAPSTGPPAELPPLPPNARPKLSRSIPGPYFTPSPEREFDNSRERRRAERVSFSTRSYASTSIRPPRKSQRIGGENSRDERQCHERRDGQVSRTSNMRGAAHSRGSRDRHEGREEVDEIPHRRPRRPQNCHRRREDSEEGDGEALIAPRERVHRSRSSRARPHDREYEEAANAPSERRSHRSKVSSVRTEDFEGDNWVTHDVLRERRARRHSRADRIAKAEQYQREQRKLWLTSSESTTSSDKSSGYRY